jgi:hypothetical protein
MFLNHGLIPVKRPNMGNKKIAMIAIFMLPMRKYAATQLGVASPGSFDKQQSFTSPTPPAGYQSVHQIKQN